MDQIASYTHTNKQYYIVMEQKIHQNLLKGTALEHRLLKVALLLLPFLDESSGSNSTDNSHSDDNTSDGTTRKTVLLPVTEQLRETNSFEGVCPITAHKSTAASILTLNLKKLPAHVNNIFTVGNVISSRHIVVVVVLLVL